MPQAFLSSPITPGNPERLGHFGGGGVDGARLCHGHAELRIITDWIFLLLRYTKRLFFGGVTDSTTVTKPAVHAVMTANHVNPKLLTNSCQRRQLRTSGLNPVSGLSQDASIEGVTVT